MILKNHQFGFNVMHWRLSHFKADIKYLPPTKSNFIIGQYKQIPLLYNMIVFPLPHKICYSQVLLLFSHNGEEIMIYKH